MDEEEHSWFMNSTAVLVLLGGAAVVAVAASASSGTPATEGDKLFRDAEQMVKIFNFYATSMGQLTDTELQELARLNLKAKGEGKFYTEVQYGEMVKDSQGKNLFQTSDSVFFHAAWGTYNSRYYLPPGVATDIKEPDAFSAWIADRWPPWLDCTQRFVGGLGSPEGSGRCGKGTLFDGFFRTIGSLDDPNAGVVRGESDLMAIGEGLVEDFKGAAPAILRGVASVASNYPGIGTAIAVAATFLAEVSSGAGLEDATLVAGRSAVPSALQGAYDVGVGLALTGEFDVKKTITVAMALAISQGAIDGKVLERFDTIKAAYNDVKEIQGGVGILDTAVQVGA